MNWDWAFRDLPVILKDEPWHKNLLDIAFADRTSLFYIGECHIYSALSLFMLEPPCDNALGELMQHYVEVHAQMIDRAPPISGALDNRPTFDHGARIDRNGLLRCIRDGPHGEWLARLLAAIL